MTSYFPLCHAVSKKVAAYISAAVSLIRCIFQAGGIAIIDILAYELYSAVGIMTGMYDGEETAWLSEKY